MSERAIFDPGLQPERTALAWRRTGLSILVGGVVATRALSLQLGPFTLLASGFAVAIAVVVLVGAELRYRRDTRALVASANDHVPLSGGGMIFVVAIATFTLGVGAVALVLAVVLT